MYWINEGENRRFFDPNVENQLILHSHLHYRLNDWDFGGGLTLSWIYAQIPEQLYNHSASEIRPFLEVSREHKLGHVFFQNRIRIDNRFLESSVDKSIWEESYYVARLRYRAQLRLVLQQKDGKPTVGARIGDEIMLNSKRNTFDQNRVYVSVDFQLLRSLSVEPSYVFVYQQRLNKGEFFSRHVLRISLIHRMFTRNGANG